MGVEVLNVDDYIEQGNLGRHETFTPRYGWLKKGYDAVTEDGNVFKAPDAIERLGVGKNMVRSIRFWCQAFKLIKSDKTGFMETTLLGDKLLGGNGWDPFLEDIASLWLLHWQLFIPSLDAVNWSIAFNKCNLWSFNLKQLADVLITNTSQYQRLAKISDKTFGKDASCIIRMYVEDTSDRDSEIDCPFNQLGLIRHAEHRSTFTFEYNHKYSLPALIFAAACFSYIANYVPPSQKTISIHRLTYDFNSPGVVFKVPESVTGSYLLDAANFLPGISLVDQIGSTQLNFEGEPKQLYWKALEKYYEEKR